MTGPDDQAGPADQSEPEGQAAPDDQGRDFAVPMRRSRTADLYELWTLDIVPSVGGRAARAFETRPKQFKRTPIDVAETLARLRYQTGHNEIYLSETQRRELVEPLLGESDGTDHSDETSKFHQAAAGLRSAAVDYVQRSFDTGERQLRNAFRDAAKTMYAYLTVIEGSVTAHAMARLTTHFVDVVKVARSASKRSISIWRS
ncbi:hypothetical protein [Actinomycetospora chibensis]|uniref:Uncharacterized protein n=1 Tax=Actinomycetospora chibensis TaxID=663606 RepID=A0ABV9RPH0_9PSEU|nr:hypothetical protein [Actinomycetospora chibensis]MDD7926949.1 hypothetical protein [Actinomycetospora chibensis]